MLTDQERWYVTGELHMNADQLLEILAKERMENRVFKV